MTVHSGKGWRLAPSLVAMENEADRMAPRRSRKSDGSIGDAAHRKRKSDHNPSGGFVHGLDLTHDPKGGFDAHAHARNVAARHDGRIEYIISNGMIAERENGFRWKKYTGSNPHKAHAHFSVRHTNLARYDTSPWFNAIVLFPTPTPQPSPDLVALAKLREAINYAKLGFHNIGTPEDLADPNRPGRAEAIKLVQVGVSRWFDGLAAMAKQPNPPDIPVTGVWDDATKWWVIQLQRLSGVNELGTVGLGTWALLYP